MESVLDLDTEVIPSANACQHLGQKSRLVERRRHDSDLGLGHNGDPFNHRVRQCPVARPRRGEDGVWMFLEARLSAGSALSDGKRITYHVADPNRASRSRLFLRSNEVTASKGPRRCRPGHLFAGAVIANYGFRFFRGAISFLQLSRCYGDTSGGVPAAPATSAYSPPSTSPWGGTMSL
jgi:hypothetical protein